MKRDPRHGPVRSLSSSEVAQLQGQLKPPMRVIEPTPDFVCRRGAKQQDEAQERVEVIAVRQVGQTARAVGFELPDRAKPLWVPHRFIQDREDMDDGTLTFTVPRWLAANEGLC